MSMEAKLLETFKNNQGLRITLSDKWLVYNDGIWEVYSHKLYKKHTHCEYSGTDFKEAIDVLVE